LGTAQKHKKPGKKKKKKKKRDNHLLIQEEQAKKKKRVAPRYSRFLRKETKKKMTTAKAEYQKKTN
jgi:hypothetical protein